RVAVYKATAATGRHDEALAARVTDEVVATLSRAWGEEASVPVEDVQDLVERVLIESGSPEVAKAYIVYRHDRARLRMARRTAERGNIPYKAMWESLDWAVTHGCHTVAALNETIRAHRLPELIAAADRRYEADIERAAGAVLERRNELRFIIVAGPSSSGKTTTTHKLAQHLETEGLHVVPLPLDNYFFDLELHPGDEFGDSDFETPEALDLQLINRHLAELDQGRAIDMPVYDFKTGKRRPETAPFAAPPGSLILLDTLHGLYDGLTASVGDPRKLRLYIETISQLKDGDGRYVRWTDIRMLRRMARDARFRAYQPERTILHWHYVRRSELKHIIPWQASADVHVNGALAYELPFLKLHLFAHLSPFLEKYRGDEKRLDGYLRAGRVHRLLAAIADVEDDSAVPATSLLREFIGGGSYDVH
ncbi:MAG: ATP cone domain-containing protein, partial [Acidobacteriota bacterium]|nr:ATP cone domain-containing protein [Acidobacteriota bacterium]